MTSKNTGRLLAALILIVALTGCQTVYYNTMEKFGVQKRHIFVDRIKEARDSQQEAKEQFVSALERFTAVIKINGGELEQQYLTMKADLDRSENKAAAVHKRIGAVEEVAEDLFDELQEELQQFSNESLRQASKDQLTETKRQYKKFLAAMKKAEARIEPVLVPLRDQVLYLKHNLNARALNSLRQELHSIELEVTGMVREMEKSIVEADALLANFQ